MRGASGSVSFSNVFEVAGIKAPFFQKTRQNGLVRASQGRRKDGSMSTLTNAAAVRAFRIIDALAKANEPQSLAEIVRAVDLPKQTVYRLLRQLCGARLVTRLAPAHRYECSAVLRGVAINLLMTAGPAASRHAILRCLADDVQETCNLTISSGDSMIYLDRIERHWEQATRLTPGARLPFHCTSSGKLFLSFLPKQQRVRWINDLPLRRYTEHTITDRSSLGAALRQIRRQKFAINVGEYSTDVIAIAAPIWVTPKRVLGAVSIQTSPQRHAPSDLKNFLPRLVRAATAMSSTFE